jgi:ubiquinone/menaquinone biosynthesis C-methylase UbiE
MPAEPSVAQPAGRFGPDNYAAWRASSLGSITEALERRLLLRLAGELRNLDVLDIGCGDGTLALACRQGGAARVVGCDADPRMIAQAAGHAARAGAAIELLVARAERLPFRDASFDLVSIVTVLAFVSEADQAMREMARVLRPGGRLVIGELGKWSCWAARRLIRGWLGSAAWRAARFRSAAELRALAQAVGLRVERVSGAIYFPPVTAMARLMAPADAVLGEMTTLGAAFIVLAARKVLPGLVKPGELGR